MIHCIVSYYRLIQAAHVHLVVILYVLSEVYNVLVHDFQGVRPACSFLRCPSTIRATYVSIFHRAYTCGIVVVSVCVVSVWY